LAVKDLPYKAFKVPIKPKWVKPDIPEESVTIFTKNKALRGSLKSLLKKPIYL
jgi:hypothetical protein